MRPLLLLLAVAAAALADEPQADVATSHLPADALLVVRLAPPERLDAIGVESRLTAMLGAHRPLGQTLLGGVGRATLDRSKPVYWALRPGGPALLVRAAAGKTSEVIAALGEDASQARLLDDGWIRVAEGDVPAEAAEPLPLLAGDVSLVVPVARLVSRYRATLAEAPGNLDGLDRLARKQGIPVPPAVLKLVKILAGKVLAALFDVTDVHYALSFRDGRLESEGWIRTREGSPLRRWLEARAGTKPNDLMGLLPERSFWMVESSGTAAGLDADVAALLDEAFGEGSGRLLLLLLSPSYALHDQLTGQAAGAIVVHGLMAMSMKAVHEVKPEAKVDEAIAALDAEKLNRLLAGLGAPIDVRLERDFARSGATPLHRLTFGSTMPALASYVMQMQTCFAVEGRYLLVAQSAFAENELKSLIEKVRGGERRDHPHTKAMERLMADRQEGLSVNLGTLKPVLGMFALAVPDGAKVVAAFPDDFWLSTALAVRGGHIHFRGDWPLKACIDFAERVSKMR